MPDRNDKNIYAKLRQEIDRKLENPRGIEIDVQNGIVTLTGLTDSFADQIASEEIAKAIPKVVGVVQNIQLSMKKNAFDADQEIAHKCKTALELNRNIPRDRLTVVVKDGCVFLQGEVDTIEQKKEAEATIYRIPGIDVLKSEIVVKPDSETPDIHQEICNAFKFIAEHHAHYIKVEFENGTVVLSGTARAWFEMVEAERVASELPGVKEVINNIELTPLLKGKVIPPPAGDMQHPCS